MGFNQHTRGVWCNNLIYNIHLLTGKLAEPGNSPFSLTGQPSACGTAREVGTFSHRLPADLVVTNPKHRATAERIWNLPEGVIPPKPGYHAVLQNRMLRDGKLNACWIQVNNNLQAAPNMQTYPGYRHRDHFIVVSDAYHRTAQAADLILPTAMWVEKEGAYGNAERRTQFWHQLIDPPGPPGEAKSDLWQLVEFSKRFELASHEWARFEANDSLECRNCHSEQSMDFTRQSPRAAEAHERFLVSGEKTCIDCHKGIAHRMPAIPEASGMASTAN